MFLWAAEKAQQLGVFVVPSTKMAVTNICETSVSGDPMPIFDLLRHQVHRWCIFIHRGKTLLPLK